MDNQQEIIVRVAHHLDTHYALRITDEMESSAKARGTGIAKRSPEYVAAKMLEGKAVIAVTTTGQWVGFCYIEEWSHGKFVANSGLIVAPEFRKTGVAKKIKQRIFQLSREKYPEAKIFGLTTGLAVMKINSELGYEPVTYSELTDDEEFWAGCKSCVNYDILMSKERKNCMCTAMLFDPKDKHEPKETTANFEKKRKVYERLLRLKQLSFGKIFKRKETNGNPTKNKSLFHAFLPF
ncbi:GNAT family N-acetyltransferase [Hydrotalea flava]|uniref:GNAT family N-acetyltransferase n=1 Tax=Hydrotalea flava TaxID=714549 RepID=UPI000ADAEEAE|nr:GNAT family N-acetyltransferase [Hydrotalea flava]